MTQKRIKSKSANPFLENSDHMGEMTVRQLVELVSTPEFPKGLDTTIRIGDVEGNNGVNGDHNNDNTVGGAASNVVDDTVDTAENVVDDAADAVRDVANGAGDVVNDVTGNPNARNGRTVQNGR